MFSFLFSYIIDGGQGKVVPNSDGMKTNLASCVRIDKGLDFVNILIVYEVNPGYNLVSPESFIDT